MKKFRSKFIKLLALIVAFTLLIGNVYAIDYGDDETSIKSTTEQYLTLLAKEMYLYETTETDTLTIASLDASLQDDSINQISGFYRLSELKTDLETIDALAEYTKFYREMAGITRENFNVSYSFSDIEIYDDYATLTAKEHISFHYTHMTNFNELTELINTYSLELVKVNNVWFIAKVTSDCIFTPEAIERGINLDEAISEISAEMASIPDDDFEDTDIDINLPPNVEIEDELDDEVTLVEMSEQDKVEWQRIMDESNRIPEPVSDNSVSPKASYIVNRIIGYDKYAALQYANTYWSEGKVNGFNWRNESVFHEYGQYIGQGDCQNFASQCIYAGLGGSNDKSAVMNKLRPAVPGNKSTGWYGSPDKDGCSSSWYSASAFRNYRQNIQSNKSALVMSSPYSFYPTLTTRPSTDIGSNYSTVLLASPAHVYGNNQPLGHAIFITKVNGDSWSKVLYTAHSPSALNAAITDFIGANKEIQVFSITGMRTSQECAYSAHLYSSPSNNNYDCTCNSCGFNRLIVRPTSPTIYSNIIYGSEVKVGGSAYRYPDSTSGTAIKNTCYQMAICVTKPDGTSLWAPSLQNTSSISTSIIFNQRGIWKIEVVARDINPSLTGSTSVSNTFTLRIA